MSYVAYHEKKQELDILEMLHRLKIKKNWQIGVNM
jgi:hypothetical protein